MLKFLLLSMSMRVGDMSVQVMQTLDEANTTKYKNPSPHKVNVNIKKGPFIIVSGHDLRDLGMLLEQTGATCRYLNIDACSF